MLNSPSPNYDDRTDGVKPDMLILHYTGMQSGAEAISRLQDPEAKVSAHYVVEEDGTTHVLVHESKRAWHAGVSHWQGVDGVNNCSIGVEIVNPGHEFGYIDFPDKQMQAVLSLCQDIVARNDIKPERVLGHSDVAFMRKEDPGERFNWALLAEGGVGKVAPKLVDVTGAKPVTQNDAETQIKKLQQKLQTFGFGIAVDGIYGDKTTACVTAFQRHWVQDSVTGMADAKTVQILEILSS